MKNIALGVLIFFCVTHGFTASQKAAKQRRLRREQPTAPPNTTTVYTKHDDIAHFTCTTRDEATIIWKRERTELENADLGVEILSIQNGDTLKSHLFIAITDDDLRGKYTCTSSDEPDVTLQAFIIENDPDREGMLSPEEYWAIILSLAISLFLAISIAFFLWRGNRRIKKARKEAKEQRTSHRSRNNHVGAEENLAVEEEVLEIGGNSTLKKETEDENNEKKTNGNGNMKVPEQRDKLESPSDMNKNMKTEVVIESPPVNEKKDVESSTQF
ncbi:uncharacterized protein LOC110061179 [Orbicella faveolata]|uniref:uncharacterized protein LOC110061179 n=1 Tax=Orbicella faveolata TaxID=48498 RepID=UPI0009E6183E|nr:uncharacterized protein LOC110061179 [Orbicella faveolata]